MNGHDRGAKIIARGFRDAGFEVIYTGIRRTPREIATAAVQEDAAVVGLSLLSGAHNTLVPAVIEELRRAGAGDIAVVVGGVIPADDVAGLLEVGVDRVFTAGTPLEAILDAFRELCARSNP